VAREEGDRQQEHQHRPDQPVLDQGQRQNPAVPEHLPQFLILDLGQRRIHHHDQADGDGNIGGPDLKDIDEISNPGEEIAAEDPGQHGDKNPQGEKAIDK